ncbi:uncharacterized protein At5g39865 [Cajanus cajan]|uniref:Uncharacterized protein At5g39865 family n=1 Tax=Cajanus cajan TaxID=3821 RepID=A0A151R1H3_CAJCA|nr:uncharacterized protein At5g39865 [Cajanus cajan]KYP36359.1 Uncharacterized protein At5g39865 family [Cajanus cajan]
MWPPWNKSAIPIHTTSSSFSCSSFKDIQSLCLEEPPLPATATKPSVFHRVRLANSLLRTCSTHLQPLKHSLSLSLPQPHVSKPTIYFPGAEHRVVVYYTSLRVVRPTFEACKTVLSILRGFRVRIDDRDVSMDSAFAHELNRIMGRHGPDLHADLGLPRVFIAGRYVGGLDEVRHLNEVGELKRLLQDLPAVDPSDCHVCAAHRFVLCDHCNGSRKVYTDKSGFKTCNACNENGLVRCPSCLASASSPFSPSS